MIIKFFNINICERIKSIEDIRNEKWFQEGKIDIDNEREILIYEMEKRRKKLDDFNENNIYNDIKKNNLIYITNEILFFLFFHKYFNLND